MRAESIERAVRRALVVSIAVVALAVFLVSAVATTAVVVRRDDMQAQAQAQNLAAELRSHQGDPEDAFAQLVEHELAEQQPFGRGVEVWRNHAPLAPRGAKPQLGAWVDLRGCTSARLQGSLARVCAARGDLGIAAIVQSPLRPLLAAQLPLVLSIAASAALAALVFAFIARKIARRALLPLHRFESALSEFSGAARSRLPNRWHAQEVDQLARTFNALLERIDRTVEREQRFVANAAHELRTPVTRLRGQLELVAQDDSLSTDAQERLALATRSCLELGRSLESILALARDEAPAMQTLDLGDVARDALASFTAEERQQVTASEGSAIVRGEPVLLELAVRNLLDNALKYGDGSVQLTVGAVDGTCQVVVRDRGPGLSAPDLLRVREPFVRGAVPHPRARGSGLGLALVEHVAGQHGGRLDLANGAGVERGLIATLELPAWRPAPRVMPP